MRQRVIDLEAENANINVEKAELEARDAEYLKQVMETILSLRSESKD